ncbi:MAG: PDDEXK nuclease domain-containing protein [Chitinophagales bacterium]
MTKQLQETEQFLFTDIKHLIESSRQRVAVAVNAEITMLYWNIGKHISQFLLNDKRAAYGKQILWTLSQELTETYGKGWHEKTLRHCLRSAETFTKIQIVSAVRRQMSWTHIRTIMYLKDEIQREFYLEICANERWSSRQLQERINSMLFERTAISKKPELTIQNDLEKLRTTQEISLPLVFKDPYLLDFLGLADTYSEKDLEQTIVYQLQLFILELGNDFAFMARQKRITVDDTDYYIDLLFYHRKLRRLVAIDLKLGKFEHSHKSQMELYLRWLAKYEQQEHEQAPIGLILCADKSNELVELLEMDATGIQVAQYLTELPSKELLQQKLHEAIAIAKHRLENKKMEEE